MAYLWIKCTLIYIYTFHGPKKMHCTMLLFLLFCILQIDNLIIRKCFFNCVFAEGNILRIRKIWCTSLAWVVLGIDGNNNNTVYSIPNVVSIIGYIWVESANKQKKNENENGLFTFAALDAHQSFIRNWSGTDRPVICVSVCAFVFDLSSEFDQFRTDSK